MNIHLAYLYLLSPLHTGGTSQEGNVVGIAREVHTEFPYLPSSSIRGRLRAEVDGSEADDSESEEVTAEDARILARVKRAVLFGPDLKDIQDLGFSDYFEYQEGRKLTQLEQGCIWIGDGSILWIPVPSISHGVVWISCPLLLQRWTRLNFERQIEVPEYASNLPKKGTVYLKDATIPGKSLQEFPKGMKVEDFIPHMNETSIQNVLVVPNGHCRTLIEMSLWRQVKVKLNEHKVVIDGSFRYEEAIPPETLMYFSWGLTRQMRDDGEKRRAEFRKLLANQSVLQFGGQESLGRGFVRQWTDVPQAKQSNHKTQGG